MEFSKDFPVFFFLFFYIQRYEHIYIDLTNIELLNFVELL